MRLLVLLFSILMPLVGWLSQRGAFGPTNAAISDQYPTLLLAAGPAFAIWGVIFLLDLVYGFWQATGTRKSDDTLRAVSEMRSRLTDGKLHALVNNAAISPKGALPGEARGAVTRLGVLESEMVLWRQVFEVNFFSTIWLAQGLKEELARAQGAIVNITSIAGGRVHPFAGTAYATSKAALGSLTREMAHDFGPAGIRVNAIAPGEIDTAILSPGTEKIVGTIPLRRLGTTAEVADIIFFLCSNQAAYVTGSEIHINGGQHV